MLQSERNEAPLVSPRISKETIIVSGLPPSETNAPETLIVSASTPVHQITVQKLQHKNIISNDSAVPENVEVNDSFVKHEKRTLTKYCLESSEYKESLTNCTISQFSNKIYPALPNIMLADMEKSGSSSNLLSTTESNESDDLLSCRSNVSTTPAFPSSTAPNPKNEVTQQVSESTQYLLDNIVTDTERIKTCYNQTSNLSSSSGSDCAVPWLSEIDNELLRTSLLSQPKDQLVGALKRAISSVENINELLHQEIVRSQKLDNENSLFNDTIGQLLTSANHSDALARASHNHSLLVNAHSVAAAKIEQASEAAATYAIPLVKTAFQSFVSQVTSTLQDANLPKSSLVGVRAEQFHGRYTPWQCKQRNEANAVNSRSPSTLQQTSHPPQVSPISSVVGKIRETSENEIEEIKKDNTPTDNYLALKLLESESLSTIQQSTVNSSSSSIDLITHKNENCCEITDTTISNTPSVGSNVSNAKMAIIFYVTLILDDFHDTHCDFQISATDSIQEVIDQLDEQYFMNPSLRQALVHYLEREEEKAIRFPLHLQIHMSQLLSREAY